jgi:hypothetical protein
MQSSLRKANTVLPIELRYSIPAGGRQPCVNREIICQYEHNSLILLIIFVHSLIFFNMVLSRHTDRRIPQGGDQ